MGIHLRLRVAEVHMSRQYFTCALEEVKQCLEVCKQKGYRELGAYARLLMARALFELGDDEAAFRGSKDATSEFKAMGDEFGESHAYRMI